MLPFVESIDESIYYYLATIGSLVAFIVILCILLNTIYHYVKMFYKQESGEINDNQSKLPYHIFFIINIFSLWACIDAAFIRSNIFTAETIDKFTHDRCNISHLIVFILLSIEQMALYSHLLIRIQISFQDSIYAYSSKTYKSLYISMVVIVIISMILPFFSITTHAQYALYYFDSNRKLIWCDVLAGDQYFDGNDSRRIFAIISGLFVLLYSIIYDVILLYMFTKSLYALQAKLLEQHMSEMAKMDCATSPSIDVHQEYVDSPDTPSIDVQSNEDVPKMEPVRSVSMTKRRTLTVEAVRRQSSKDNYNQESAKRLMKLHELIQKFTILIWILIIVNIVWCLTLLTVSSWMWLLLVYPLIMNNICTWLMFARSEKYWNFGKKYCCCYLCFCNKSRDIDSKNCICFC